MPERVVSRPQDARPAGHTHPASFGQQRLWFLDRLLPGQSWYVIPGVYRIRGRLDMSALAAAMTEVIGRHDSLRTTFRDDGGELVQVVAPAAPFTISTRDLSGLAPAACDAAVRDAIDTDMHLPFDLVAGPLLRMTVLRADEDDHYLLFCVHHIAFDGVSAAIMFDELRAAYDAHVTGKPVPLAEPTSQYGDYARWQREHADSPAFARQLAYWKRQLADLPGQFALPTDRPRPAERSAAAANELVALPADLTSRLEELGRQERGTLFMVLLAALQVVLSRYTGRSDNCVCTAIAGRTRRDWQPLIGFFANTLPLRVDLSGEPAFREAVRLVRTVLIDAMMNQDVPYDRIVRQTGSAGRLAQAQMFQVMVTMQQSEDAQGAPLDLPGLTTESVELPYDTTDFDLTLTFAKDPDGGLGAMLNYSVDLFDAETARALLRHLRNILSSAVVDPEQPVTGMDMLDDTERHELLTKWNRAEEPIPQQPLPLLFESQTARTPDAVAVIDRGGELRYSELNARANRLAHHLIGLRAGPEDVVALAIPPSAEMVVAMLAVLKAGAAYLPLDTDGPPEHIASLLDDAQPICVVTTTLVAPRLPADDREQLTLDTTKPADALDVYPSTDPGDGDRTMPLRMSNAAHVIDASGSNGRPKCVVIQHDSPANHLDWATRTYPGTRGTALLHSPPILDPLVTGGCVMLAELTGERQSTADAPYGAVPIGRPPGNVRAYVLDEGLQPVPAGVTGTLYVGGAGLARGYLNRPGLTAERFVPDPYGPPGSRMYRTGDLARRQRDGGLVYVARTDGQLTVRDVQVEREVDRAALSAPEVAAEGSTAEPQTPSEVALAEIWATVLLEAGPIGIHDDFFAVGGHSLSALWLTTLVAERLGGDLTLADVFTCRTIAEQAELLDAASDESTGDSTPVLIPLTEKRPDRRPLILIPSLWGDPAEYRWLAEQLAGDYSIYSPLAPGLEPGTGPLDRIEDIAGHYVRALDDAGCAEPYLIGGFSHGGIIALEMALQLTERGHTVDTLLLFGRPAEEEIAAITPADDHPYHDAEPDQAERMITVARAGLSGLADYRPRATYERRAVIVSAEDDPHGPSCGWGRWVPGQLDVRGMPGLHDDMLTQANTPRLAAEIRASLTRPEDGEVDRAALPDGSTVEPRTPAEVALAEIWATVLLRTGPIGIHEDFFAVGGHSFSALWLTTLVSERLGGHLTMADVFACRTIAEQAELLEDGTRGSAPVLIPLTEKRPDRPPLILIPSLWGNPAEYRWLAEQLADDYSIYSPLAPGLEPGTHPLGRIEDIAGHYVRALDDAGCTEPYLIGGFSHGGIIALEMALQLTERGHTVDTLLMVDSRAHAFETGGRLTEEEIATLTPDDDHPYHHAEPDQAERMITVARAGLSSLTGYQPRATYQGHAVIVSAEGGPDDPYGTSRGWEQWVPGRLDVRSMPGLHDDMLTQANTPRLAAEIRAGLTRPEGG